MWLEMWQSGGELSEDVAPLAVRSCPMSEYKATVYWQRFGAAFTDQKYSRAHEWRFDGGVTVPGSSSPHVVRPPLSDPAAVDPEEAFVASLSSCHMLFFLSLAAKQGFVIDSYEDAAVGVMAKNAAGKMAMTVVTLRPKAIFVGRQPTPQELQDLHHRSHEECFIASSVKTDVRCEPVA
jgi:organic hydroperoxide reductase OsmC/OhrA